MYSILDLQPDSAVDDQASFEAAIKENAANAGVSTGSRRKRSLVNYSKLWANGRTLKVAFMDDPEAGHKQKIIDIASQWMQYTNLTFDFVEGKQGDIRVATETPYNSSVLGTDALIIVPYQATLNIAAKPDHEDFVTVVLHEFGHALGAMHEHQHPKVNIPWDKPKVYQHYKDREMNPLTKEQVDQNVFTPFDTLEALYLDYDTKSIMHYPVLNSLTLGDWHIPTNRKISKKDKQLMRLLYPK